MLHKFADFVVDRRKWFFAVFIVLTAVCAGLIFLVKINYNMMDYLPKTSYSRKSLDVMTEEFGDSGSASFMISRGTDRECFVRLGDGYEPLYVNDRADTYRPCLGSDLLPGRAARDGESGDLWVFTKDGDGYYSCAVREDDLLVRDGDGYRKYDDARDRDVVPADITPLRKSMERVKGVKSVLWMDSALVEYYPAIKDQEIEIAPGLKKDLAYFVRNTLGVEKDAPDKVAGEAFADWLLDNYEDVGNKNTLIGGMIPEGMSGMVDMMTGQFFREKEGKHYALIQVFFDENGYDKKTVNAVTEMKGIIADAGYVGNLGGMASPAYNMETIMESELFQIVLAVAPVILALLFLATSSFFEPVVYIIIIGISVILNMGTNLILPSVSYLTFSIAALIQVAVSMDYSIFIMHNYRANRAAGMLPADASKAALKRSLSPVSASSMTTIAGFVALIFMRYKIGADIGIVLSKGILCSLITAFLFMPGFLVMTDKAIMKGSHATPAGLIKKKYTEHMAGKRAKPEIPGCLDCSRMIPADNVAVTAGERAGPVTAARRAADGLLKLRFVLPLLFVVLLAPAYVKQSGNNFTYGEVSSSGGPGSSLMIDREAIWDVFGSQNNVVVMVDRKNYDESKELEITDRLAGVKNVISAGSLSKVKEMMGEGMPVPEFMEKQFVGENYSMIVLAIDTGEEDAAAFETVDNLKKEIKDELDNGCYILGSTVSAQELKEINNKDYVITTSLALAFIFVILLLTFRGLVLPLVLAMLIQGSIWFAMTIPSFIEGKTLVFLGYLIVNCFQMGCTIDYGILFSNNYLHFRKNADRFTACREAFKTSVGAITLSAGILISVGFTVGLVGSIPSTSDIGLLLGTGASVSYLAMTYLLPLFLVLLDKPILATTLRLERKKREKAAGTDA